MQHFFFFSGSITTFFLVLLLSKRDKAGYDKLLIVWFSIILFHIAIFYLASFDQFIFLLELSSAAVFLSGPLLWLYTRQLTRNNEFLSWRHFLHFLPFFLNLVVISPYLLQGKLAPFSEFFRELLAWLKLSSILIYALAIILEIRRHRTLVKENLSNLEAVHLKWLQFVVYGILGIWFAGFASQFLFHSGLVELPHPYEDIAVNIAVSFFVIIIGYYGFIQAPIFVGPDAKSSVRKNEKEHLKEPSKANKYKKSGINIEKVQYYASKLDSLMTEQKPFKDPELTLTSLATLMELSPNQLSQIINEHYQQSFYDFVNSYRVEEVKKMLDTSAVDHLTLLGVGLNAGFNSKASFNRYFKKHTGKTPSEYYKAIQASQNPL